MNYNNDILIDWFLYLDNQFKKNKKNTQILDKKREIQEICQQRIINYTKKDCEIVIAKYQEDLSWVNKYRHLATIYDKSNNPIKNSIKLNNVGRESHTYLYHIINNWDRLADNTLFTQGGFTPDHNPFPLETYLIKKNKIKLFLNLYYQGIDFRDKIGSHLKHRFKWLEEFQKGLMKPAVITFDQFWSLFNNTPIKNYDSIIWSHGAIFSISKELILSQPLKLYVKLYNLLINHVNPEEGHYFERTWYYIFNSKTSNQALSYDQLLIEKNDYNIKHMQLDTSQLEEIKLENKDEETENLGIEQMNKLNFSKINYLEDEIDNKIKSIKKLFQNNFLKIEQIENL